jgi:choline kinase
MSIKVGIAMACNRTIKAKTFEALLKMVDHADYDYEFIIAIEGYTIAENRIYCVMKALKANCTHLLFLDDDMTFPPETLEQLLSHEKEIVGVVASPRIITENTTVLKLDGEVLTTSEIPKELFEVAHVGTGVMLIDMEVFKKIDQPYFKFTTHPNGMTLDGEDAYFCQQARKKDIKIYCDPTLSIGHIGDYLY